MASTLLLDAPGVINQHCAKYSTKPELITAQVMTVVYGDDSNGCPTYWWIGL